MSQQEVMVVILVIAVIVALAVILAAAATIRGRRNDRLRQRYGPEYDRTVQDTGDFRRTEPIRETRVQRLHITPLTPEQSQRFSDEWRQVQARFVDEPAGALLQADRLIGDMMASRGYPVGDFEQRVEDISVEHPDIVMNYRAARTIIEEHARHPVSTEDMRQAMMHYRALFKDLIGDTTPVEERRIEPPVGATRDRRERP